VLASHINRFGDTSKTTKSHLRCNLATGAIQT
jgi:hypothetical protein